AAVTTLSPEVRVVRLLDEGDLEARQRPEVPLLGLVVGRARRRDERGRAGVAQRVAEVLRFEPEVARALVHQLGQDLLVRGPVEGALPAGCAALVDQLERGRGIALRERRLGDDVAGLEPGGDADG